LVWMQVCWRIWNTTPAVRMRQADVWIGGRNSIVII
jgi:hypothetical protein